MCMKTPKPKKVEDKPVQYFRNPFLDGLAIGRNQGRSSLRIDRGSGTAAIAASGKAPAGTQAAPIGGPIKPYGTGLAIPTRDTRAGLIDPRLNLR